jgi:hypothetical protein
MDALIALVCSSDDFERTITRAIINEDDFVVLACKCWQNFFETRDEFDQRCFLIEQRDDDTNTA